MITLMRTTVLLDDDLFQQAKRRAADTGKSLSQVIAEALRSALQAKPPVAMERFRMVTFGGRRRVRHEPAELADALEEDDRARAGR